MKRVRITRGWKLEWWTCPDGVSRQLRTAKFGRTGTLSPTLFMVCGLDGRWLTPYAREHYGYRQRLQDIFRNCYPARVLRKLFYAKNPLLFRLPKEDSFAGKYIPVPLNIGK